MVGAINNSSNLSKISEYPYHVRIKVTSDFLCAYLAFSFQLLHWKHINVVYNDDTYEKGFYDAFANNVDRYGITITNREEFRKFDKDPEIAKK